MSHIVRRLDWGVIDLDTVRGRVFFQQTWFYVWEVVAPASAWTADEKRAFHHELDRQIWGHWSMRFRFVPQGQSPLVHQFSSGMPIDLDVKWILHPGDFTVHVTKRPGKVNFDNAVAPTDVDFTNKQIRLNQWDTGSYKPKNAAGASAPQPFRPLPHEFGHALGTANDDEYQRANANLPDTNSIMNIGNQVRSRHLETICAQLTTMIPGVKFMILGPHHRQGHHQGIGRKHAHGHH